MSVNDETFMREALAEAQKALDANCFPVGAVLVKNGQVIGRAHKNMDSNQLNHAETNLLRQYFKGSESGEGLTLYSTLEPCLMCYGTMRHCRIERLVYAVEDPYGGAAHMQEDALPLRHHHRPMQVTAGVLRTEAIALFKTFLDTTTEPYWKAGGAKEFADVIRQHAIR